MAKEKANGNANTSLALAESSASAAVLGGPAALALATEGDQLATMEGLEGIEIEDDGLTEVGQEDIKLATKVFNFKGTQSNGDPIMPNTFYDTLTEQIDRELDLILIKTHKTNEWREYDEAAKKSNVRCRSFDRLKGVMEDGTIRPCIGCPDAEWKTLPDKNGRLKRSRRCGPVHNVFAVQVPSLQPCVIRFRRTSLRVIQDYFSRYHMGKRKMRNPKTGAMDLVNYPLFSFFCKASLKMSEDRQPYAIPVLTCGQVLPPELFKQANSTVKYVNQVLLGELNKIIDAPEPSTDDGDATFDVDTMSNGSGDTGGGEGQDFVAGS